MVDNLELTVSNKAWEEYWKKHINRVWSLLPMWEKNEDWQKATKTVLIEFQGVEIIVKHSPDLESRVISVNAKLAGMLKNEEFYWHRKTVFEVIGLIEELRDSAR